jgi:hypothetical protein
MLKTAYCHSEEDHNLYSSLKTIRVIKSRKIKWPGHVAHMGKMAKAHKRRDHL